MFHIMDVMGPVVTYIEVTLFQYHTFVFIAIWPMSISYMTCHVKVATNKFDSLIVTAKTKDLPLLTHKGIEI